MKVLITRPRVGHNHELGSLVGAEAAGAGGGVEGCGGGVFDCGAERVVEAGSLLLLVLGGGISAGRVVALGVEPAGRVEIVVVDAVRVEAGFLRLSSCPT